MWKELIQKAIITQTGAILLGRYIACDGFEWGRSIGAITHAHWDHISELEKSLGYCEKILMTEATRDLLIAIKGDWLLFRTNLNSLPYRTVFEYEDEKITLYPAEHMLGAAQVLVETLEGLRIVYTGDFFIPGTEPIESDVLVLDTTYGDPTNISTFSKEDSINQLASLIKKLIIQGPVHIVGSLGKIQEVMSILFHNDPNLPFIVSPKIFKVCNVYQRHGYKLGNLILSQTDEGKELLKRKQPCIVFHTLGEQIESYPRIKISGYISNWEMAKPIMKIGENYWSVVFSNHADFNGIMYYVSEARPKFVITDNKRACGKAMLAAQSIRLKFGIEALALPML